MTKSARSNLFPGSLEHLDRHPEIKLEKRSKALWSSQALCISVFGAIAESSRRQLLMEAILEAAGMSSPPQSTPELLCEVRGRRDVLHEYGGSNPTCPDVLAEWPDLVLTIESKFTEHLSPCGQVTLRERRGQTTIEPANCSGDYEVGSDLKTKEAVPCRLTVDENAGRRGFRSARLYWDVGAEVFRATAVRPPQRPCPFADRRYQLMRNICFARALASRSEKLARDYGFLLVYVGSAPSSAATRSDFAAFREMLQPAARERSGAIEYEAVASILGAHGETELSAWLATRIPVGLAALADADNDSDRGYSDRIVPIEKAP